MSVYTPWMRSLLNRMKELYNKPNAKTIAEALPELGSGGEVTPASVSRAIGEMTDTQKAQALEDLGGEPETLVVHFTNNGSSVTADYDVEAILDALDAGKTVVGVLEELHLQLVASTKSPNIAAFAGVFVNSNGQIELNELEGLTVGQTDTWTQKIPSAEIATMVTLVPGATPSIEPADHHIYKCGTLTSLTITNPPATGSYSIVFTSGATATTTTIPATILGLEDFSAEANTMYEINVLDNRAVVGSWAVSST